ncbi:hypothetical protein [Bosea sp. RAC05]|uniref:hypothetical protein n=1 Tax=Bosea sp. RAC05 TaxID=1842539 RepID=UPI00083CA73C|nr:hypothetical protein [Bosea sp. RAC05]AOG03183.1 hypothetical protein BSY19_4982 [Bosea sp. RAC05]
MTDTSPIQHAFDRLDENTYWHPLPSQSLAEAFSDEAASLFLTRTDGQWWVTRENRAPDAGPFDSLDDCLVAGNAFLSAAWERQSSQLASAAGLDPAIWGWIDDEKVFAKIGSDTTKIAVGGVRGPFILREGEDEIETCDSARAADEVLEARSQPIPCI